MRRFTPSTWDIGKEFGTIGAMKRADGQDWKIEVTTFRADIYRNESRKPDVAFGDAIDGDLVRRDFTVNAMAINVATRQFVDPYGGLDDLADAPARVLSRGGDITINGYSTQPKAGSNDTTGVRIGASAIIDSGYDAPGAVDAASGGYINISGKYAGPASTVFGVKIENPSGNSGQTTLSASTTTGTFACSMMIFRHSSITGS